MFIKTHKVSIVKSKIDNKTPVSINLDNVIYFEPHYVENVTRVIMLDNSLIDINESYDKVVDFLSSPYYFSKQ